MEALMSLVHLFVLLELPHFMSNTSNMAPTKLVLREDNVRVVSFKQQVSLRVECLYRLVKLCPERRSDCRLMAFVNWW
jgi:hypothetical protein